MPAEDVTIVDLLNAHMTGISGQLSAMQIQFADIKGDMNGMKSHLDNLDQDNRRTNEKTNERIDEIERRQMRWNGAIAVIIFAAPFVFFYMQKVF